MTIYIPSANVGSDVRDAFLRGMVRAEAQSYLPVLATTVDSDGANEVYSWLGETPALVDITGKDVLQYGGLTSATYTIENKTYARGIKIHKNTWNDQRNAALDLRLQTFGSAIVKHRNKLLIDALINGTTNTGYDGVAFFSDSHTARADEGGTQDNLLAGTGTTTAQAQTDIWSALSAMRNFKDEAGYLVSDMITDVVIVHPAGAAISKALREAVNSQIVSQTSNAGFDTRITLLGTGYLSDANDWYMLNVSEPIKPIIYQEREPMRLEEDITRFPDFDNGYYHWKIEGRHNVGYSRWQYAVKVVNS